MNIFFTSSHKIGLTSQLTEQAVEFSKITDASFTSLSGEKEQYTGLFNRLEESHIPHNIIPGLDDHADYLRLVSEFKSLVDKTSPIWVIVQTNWQLAIAAAARLRSTKRYKILYIVNGYRNNHRFRSIIARYIIGIGLYFFSDAVITPCKFVKNKFRILGNKNKIIFLGEDESMFENYPLPDFTVKKRLIFAGEFRVGKCQDLLIRAVRQYITSSGDAEIELYLPGKGEQLEKCRALCYELGLEDKVFFPGFISRAEMLNLYLACQYALVPSNSETFGHCIVEPFILGRVVITRHVGVADDIIEPGKNGFFFNNENDLSELFLRIFPNKNLCALVAENTRQKRDLFRWNRICQQYTDLIFNEKTKK